MIGNVEGAYSLAETAVLGHEPDTVALSARALLGSICVTAVFYSGFLMLI